MCCFAIVDSIESVLKRVRFSVVVGGNDPVFALDSDDYEQCYELASLPRPPSSTLVPSSRTPCVVAKQRKSNVKPKATAKATKAAKKNTAGSRGAKSKSPQPQDKKRNRSAAVQSSSVQPAPARR